MAQPANQTIEPQARVDQTDDSPVPAAPSTDETLAKRAQGGSQVSFGMLVERYEGRLLAYFRRRVGRDAAEDLAQETFVRSWSSLSRFDSNRSFSTWLFTIASRLATDHYRANGKNQRLLVGRAAVNSHFSSNEVDIHESAESDHDIWRTAHNVLTQQQVGAIWLRYVMDMRIEDLAVVLGKNRIATRVMLFRARERLGAALREKMEPANTTDLPGETETESQRLHQSANHSTTRIVSMRGA